MSAAMFAKMKELEARVKALEDEIAQLKAHRPTLTLPKQENARGIR